MGNSNLNVLQIQARHLMTLRSGFTKIYLSNQSNVNGSKETQILNDIANSFSRYAAYQQTAFDIGANRSSASGEAGSMERQVERAIVQVLGRSPGGGAQSFINALNSTFPTIPTPEGQQVTFTPTRSMISLYRPGANGDGAYAIDGFAGTISARQANLHRQAAVIAGDALRVLNGLTPFVPEAEPDQVEALRALIRSEINTLVEEFGRVDEPREDRVLAYFSSLKIHVGKFGRRSFLDRPQLAATVDDEAKVAGFELLKSYTNALRDAWEIFFNIDRVSPKAFSISERVERANILLPIVAQANTDFEASMDSVGFTENERHSMATKFNAPEVLALTAGDLDGLLSDITIYDLNEWLDRFANLEGPRILTDSGQYGLDFVTEQADKLFWVITPVVTLLKQKETENITSCPRLIQVLLNERVRFALNNLLSQLNALAELSAPGGS